MTKGRAMEEHEGSWIRRFNPGRLADKANDEFVRMAQMLARLFTLDLPVVREPIAEAPAAGGATESYAGPDGSRARGFGGGVPPLDPQTWKVLARRIDQIVNEVGIGRGVDAETPAGGTEGSPKPRKLRLGLREIFHYHAARRLSAVQRIHQGCFTDAVPLLQAVLTVEEDIEVKEAITAALKDLETT